MNILRALKIHELNGDFESIDAKEERLLFLFSDLVETKSDAKIFLKKLRKDGTEGYDEYFVYDPKKNSMWCSYRRVWMEFDDFKMNEDEIRSFLTKFFEKYLGLHNVFSCHIWLFFY